MWSIVIKRKIISRKIFESIALSDCRKIDLLTPWIVSQVQEPDSRDTASSVQRSKSEAFNIRMCHPSRHL
ncbi:hypothetical protein CEXT_792491, partial [Caerostris extrusa]